MTIDDIIACAKSHGSHFFDADARRFFLSRISSKTFGIEGNIFVTSEKHEYASERVTINEPRRYTVRAIDPETGEIDSLSSWQQFDNQREAFEWARRYGQAMLDQRAS